MPRLPLPAAYADPAFLRCLLEAIDTPELCANFDRLYGSTLFSRGSPIERMVDMATGRRDEDMLAFVKFVHRSIYVCLPDEAIHALRAAQAIKEGA